MLLENMLFCVMEIIWSVIAIFHGFWWVKENK